MGENEADSAVVKEIENRMEHDGTAELLRNEEALKAAYARKVKNEIERIGKAK